MRNELRQKRQLSSSLASAGTAMAACPGTSASTQAGTDMNKTGAIAKDGTTAPLEGAEPGTNTVAKDASTMPLATEEGGGNKDLATSEQDVEAQQEGEKTAAAKADEDKCQE